MDWFLSGAYLGKGAGPFKQSLIPFLQTSEWPSTTEDEYWLDSPKLLALRWLSTGIERALRFLAICFTGQWMSKPCISRCLLVATFCNIFSIIPILSFLLYRSSSGSNLLFTAPFRLISAKKLPGRESPLVSPSATSDVMCSLLSELSL